MRLWFFYCFFADCFLKEIALNIKQARPVIFELALSDDDREEGFLSEFGAIDTIRGNGLVHG